MSSKTKKFSINNIDGMIDYLESYKAEIQRKSMKFCNLLADHGITVAMGSYGEFADKIHFKKAETDNGVIIIVTDEKITKVWYSDKAMTNQRSYQVSPMLLAEFGSGFEARNKWGIDGVGQGTMPNSYGHAFDIYGWYWYDEQGVKHHSKGEPPSYPLYAATMSMLLEINEAAREAFK